MPYYLKHEAYLEKEVKKLRAENAALAQRVQSGRELIASTELRIAAAVDECQVRMDLMDPNRTPVDMLDDCSST